MGFKLKPEDWHDNEQKTRKSHPDFEAINTSIVAKIGELVNGKEEKNSQIPLIIFSPTGNVNSKASNYESVNFKIGLALTSW